jgi:hypothetical protein
MNLIQLLFTALFGFLILRVLLATRSGTISWRRSLFWVSLWVLGLLAVWFPQATTRAAHLIGVGRGVDAIFYLSIALLSYLIFRLYLALDRQERAITRLVSELALRDSRPLEDSDPRS